MARARWDTWSEPASYADEMHRVLAARLGDASAAHKYMVAAGGGHDVCNVARGLRAMADLPRAAYEVADFVMRVHRCRDDYNRAGAEL